MSFTQFDDFYEICCDQMEEDETLLKCQCVDHEEVVVVANRPVTTKWWEEALKENDYENEYELYPV